MWFLMDVDAQRNQDPNMTGQSFLVVYFLERGSKSHINIDRALKRAYRALLEPVGSYHIRSLGQVPVLAVRNL